MPGDIARLIGAIARKMNPVDYLAHYHCEVVVRHQDNTVDVKPYDKRLGKGINNLKPEGPAAVETIKLKTGAQVMVGFRNGNPDEAYISGFCLDQPFEEIAFRADTITLNGGTQAIARKGDKAKCGTLTAQADTVSGVVKFVYVRPDGLTIPASPSVSLLGQIDEGNDSVKG